MGGGGSRGGGEQMQIQYEPVKTAEESMKSASQETARAQEMRRGITSTFNRKSMGGGTPASMTGGTAAKLGA